MGGCCGKSKETELKLITENVEDFNWVPIQKNESQASLKEILLIEKQQEFSVKDFDTKQQNESGIVQNNLNFFDSSQTKNLSQTQNFDTDNKSPLLIFNDNSTDIDTIPQR